MGIFENCFCKKKFHRGWTKEGEEEKEEEIDDVGDVLHATVNAVVNVRPLYSYLPTLLFLLFL